MENHERVLGQARNARRVDIERLVAELAPRPDVPSSVRKVAVSRTTEAERSLGVQASQAELPAELIATSSAPPSAMRPASTGDSISARDRTCPADVDAVGAGSAGVEATRTRPEASRSCPTVVEVAARFGRAPKRREERVRQKSTAMVPAATGAYERSYPPRGGSKRGLGRLESTFSLPPENRKAGGLVSGPGSVCVRFGVRTALHRARVPGAPSHPSVRARWTGDGREHRPALSSSQRVRSRSSFRIARVAARIS